MEIAHTHTILIVDDEPKFLTNMVDIIQDSKLPYKVFLALNGETALEIANDRHPDLIITDWEMPGLSGIELINSLKKNPDTAEIPTIMCTGRMTNSNDLRIALESGAVDYIRKPIDEVELTARINSMLMLVGMQKEVQENREKILKQEVEIKTRELTSNTIVKIQYQNLLDTLHHDLNKILEEVKDASIEHNLNKIINKIKLKGAKSNWDEFITQFENIHTGFLDKLFQYCPGLTQNEARLCAFVKLNLTSNEIALITGQSTRSVDVARYRLKTKLQIGKEKSLNSFLAEV